MEEVNNTKKGWFTRNGFWLLPWLSGSEFAGLASCGPEGQFLFEENFELGSDGRHPLHEAGPHHGVAGRHELQPHHVLHQVAVATGVEEEQGRRAA